MIMIIYVFFEFDHQKTGIKQVNNGLTIKTNSD